jgi:hypothetical protein
MLVPMMETVSARKDMFRWMMDHVLTAERLMNSALLVLTPILVLNVDLTPTDLTQLPNFHSRWRSSQMLQVVSNQYLIANNKLLRLSLSTEEKSVEIVSQTLMIPQLAKATE